ncbi:uncharacterized protein BX663DRAFT_481195 [Cokeromyces recurvatus]|uniref:uncharacterized protein n=1 Tax=Cokeromyces recurvatus TaxID=90255 RepID=UPI002220EDAE|nr:uncharacterized protein BX663DRAFT_481195 [Cokeromyces recurvatus]KAI7897750.1 hypothetical protein BX663DRAFT_481195 [Cokeromyces recurvatus]
MRICYYDLLGIERQASALDIKKAYRKQALIWHPDKNGDRIQEATERFALIQEAYEVLSDPQERAWYDGHRDSILRGDDYKGQKDSSAGTTSEDLMRYFSVSEFKGYEDTPKGFYNVYRNLFQKLAMEEEEAFRNNPPEDDIHSATDYPSFGNANTPFADNDGYLGYGAYIKDFYGAWCNFSTFKSFVWMDKWRLSEAPSRYVRRQMEKENKKARETARKEYNDTVRSLAEFVRKRDPRVKAYLNEEQKRKEAAAAEQKARMLREKQEMQAKIAEYQVPEWAKVDEEEDGMFNDEEVDEDDDDEIKEFYCVVCDKAYKSERQFISHESSKRHIENVEILRQEMLADEEQFDFGSNEPSVMTEEDISVPQEIKEQDEVLVTAQFEDLNLQQDKKKKKKNKTKKMTPRWGFDEVSPDTNAEDEISMLAAALEEEQRSRRRRQGNSNTHSRNMSPSNIIQEQIPNSTTPTPDSEPAVEKQSAKTKREKRREKKKLKEETVAEVKYKICYMLKSYQSL